LDKVFYFVAKDEKKIQECYFFPMGEIKLMNGE